jgi:hypothetical protein
MDPRKLTAACQSWAVRAAIPFPFDWAAVLGFFTFAVFGMGYAVNVDCTTRRPLVRRRLCLRVALKIFGGGLASPGFA